jgi:hypothetical protein
MFIVPVIWVSAQLAGTNVEPAAVGVMANFGQFVPKFVPEI